LLRVDDWVVNNGLVTFRLPILGAGETSAHFCQILVQQSSTTSFFLITLVVSDYAK
jgi:hypothetical protein